VETVAVQYLGGSAEVHVPEAGVTAQRGEPGEGGPPVEVPAAVAGRAPGGRPARPGDDLQWLESRPVPSGGIEVLDPGEGLLAQVDLWRRAPSKAPIGKRTGEDD
jgi:hypothetical protein